VLSIRALPSSGIDYYLSDLAQELPASVPPYWVGRAAEGLELRGTCDADALRAVLDGRQPRTGQRLRSDRATVGGLDLTFTAPKSVSLLYGLGGRDCGAETVAAHIESVHGALSYLEAHGLAARRGSGADRAVMATTGMVAATFTHGVSRTLDPHLHSHVVMANLVHGEDGRWSAGDNRGLWAHAPAAAATYEAQLRHELTDRLGITWEQLPSRRFEVAGVPPAFMGEFSSRSADIQRHMAAWGTHSHQGAKVAWAVTRPEKKLGHAFVDLEADWLRRADAHGMGREVLDVVRPGRSGPDRRVLNEHLFHGWLSQSADGGARRRDVVTAFGSASAAGASAHELEQLTDLWVPGHGEVGVKERVHPLRTLVPSGYQLRALGPRPVEPSAHAVWADASRVIDQYRARWQVRSPDALGVAAHHPLPASFSNERLIDHLHTTRQLEVVRQRMRWRPPLALELDRGR
jgi:conjugative relaxase-like TrwC/TraI family protein